eukprot:CAMPEP_0172843588 /NCGR_PEP_ID=MMETSP1075-20121228/31579_1 /TAXON_ID=2916 /ORGANISM="Ceratium fusus, Strain PA161109" /LENGTH=158 /DNA_ID=CAMNT_0013687885 /DNA_START=76 /DNA_END=552 /DNA_ORIENTATION=+
MAIARGTCHKFLSILLVLKALGATGMHAEAANSAIARLHEDAKAFEEGGSALDAQGWSAFMDVSAHSAHSEKDRNRQDNIDNAITEARSFDITISDEFAQKLEDQSDTPNLRELAKEHWAAIKEEKPHSAMPQVHKQELAPQPEAKSLRSLLMGAGHA